ncbi:GL24559 [Drosophila persimilis]|uniref:GL24559 n=1 Tax=Drosophila persimilis TaxID=7234 RepID=B4GUJ9_DROPE|nr:GL24559 [Drosophila persimilis]
MSGNDVSVTETAQSDQNLMHSKEKKRRVRIILSIVTAVIFVALLATALVFILKADDDNGSSSDNSGNNGIDLEDVLSGQLYAKRFNGSWSNDNSVLYKDNASIMEYDVKTGVRTALLHNAAHYVLYEKSADGELLLLAKNYKKNFRYSFLAEYDIYNFSTNLIKPLTIQNQQLYLSMVQWAPVGNALIINYDRNLYYKKSALEPEIVITSDEQAGILNGIPDWVYEEEVFSSNVATWFNPSGTQLAFIKFDDSSTHLINFPYYGDAGDLRYQYPLHQVIAYPKAGILESPCRAGSWSISSVRCPDELNRKVVNCLPEPGSAPPNCSISSLVDLLHGIKYWLSRSLHGCLPDPQWIPTGRRRASQQLQASAAAQLQCQQRGAAAAGAADRGKVRGGQHPPLGRHQRCDLLHGQHGGAPRAAASVCHQGPGQAERQVLDLQAHQIG